MNWLERIQRAEKVGTFTEEDRFLAANWITCAVGESGIAHNWTGELRAHRLGFGFSHAVTLNLVSEAKRIYEEVQKLKP